MTDAIHTRCPGCETTFLVSAEELTHPQGLVRCGQCHKVFRAHEGYVEPPAAPVIHVEAEAIVPAAPVAAPAAVTAAAAVPIPDFFDLSPPPPSILTSRLLLWGSGIMLLIALLMAQTTFQYREFLANQLPQLRPWLETVCAELGCTVRAQRAIEAIDLIETEVSPHPLYAHALAVKSALVNRAAFKQRAPALELTITDKDGEIVARRRYSPDDYLPARQGGQTLSPQVAQDVRLEITSPGPEAAGFVLRVVRPD